MSLFRKLVILFSVVILVILSATLTIVYVESRRTIVQLSKEKAVSMIQTIDSALLSDVPDYQFESVLLNLKKQEPDLISFDIYKLNDFLYDIASTNPHRIGTQASPSSTIALGEHKVLTMLDGTTINLIVPLTGYGGMPYSADVKLSIAGDLRSNHILLSEILYIGLCALALALLSAWLFTREVLSKPLQAMMSAVNEVATGNFVVNLRKSSRRSDELGSLARSFERMTSGLQQLITRMAQTAEELHTDFEQLVESGDFTAHGALHMADVIQHLNESISSQFSKLQKLGGKMSWHLQATAEIASFAQTADADDESDLRQWLVTIEELMDEAAQVHRHLQGLASTANGQLGAIRHINRTAGRLSEMASELRTLLLTLEV
ncbi:chemotaxis protein [Alicyclobacillus tengchongensis]|nr:chemotaxis protein [Alicyclobacillus tengchongensis]